MKRVAIVGGGLAGLTCAYALKQRGIEAVVFEACNASQAAGRTAVVRRPDGFTFDVGAQYLLGPDLFRETYNLIGLLGLSQDLIAVTPVAGQLYKGTVYRHRVASAAGLLKFKGLGFTDKAMLPRLAYLLAKVGPDVDFHRPEKGIALDDETVAAFVKRELSQNILNYVAGPLISTLFFYASDETSRLLFLMLARHMYHTEMYTIRGGIGRIRERLAEQVQIRNMRIANIAGTEAGYEVGGELFSDLVVATPGDAVLSVGGVGGMLCEEDVKFFDQCRYQRAVMVVVGTQKPLDGACYALTIPRLERLSASVIAFQEFIDPTRVPSGEGVLAITGGGPDVTAEALRDDLRRIYQVEPILFESVYEWKSAMPKFPPGRYRQIAAFQARKRRNGLWFAGDYLMGPFMEAAVATAMRVGAAIAS